MKTFFAILLLSVHVFNLAGYSLFFKLLQQQNSKQTVTHIDKGTFSDADLVLIKVPLQMPYSANLTDYERYDGEIEWGGAHYNYVKRKMVNDTLYVLCLPNEHQTKLYKAENKYGQQVNDMAASKQKGNSNAVKKAVLANEYDQTEINIALTTYAGLPGKIYLHFTSALLQNDADSALRPPQA